MGQQQLSELLYQFSQFSYMVQVWVKNNSDGTIKFSVVCYFQTTSNLITVVKRVLSDSDFVVVNIEISRHTRKQATCSDSASVDYEATSLVANNPPCFFLFSNLHSFLICQLICEMNVLCVV